MVTLDSDFPGQVSQPHRIQFKIHGFTYEVEEGAIWFYSEPSGSTEIHLYDCTNHPRLNSVEFNMDWTQLGVPTPTTIEGRLQALFDDPELRRRLAARMQSSSPE